MPDGAGRSKPRVVQTPRWRVNGTTGSHRGRRVTAPQAALLGMAPEEYGSLPVGGWRTATLDALERRSLVETKSETWGSGDFAVNVWLWRRVRDRSGDPVQHGCGHMQGRGAA